jgi:hypothetical protein
MRMEESGRSGIWRKMCQMAHMIPTDPLKERYSLQAVSVILAHPWLAA